MDNDLTEEQNNKILKYCKKIIELDKKYMSEVIQSLSEIKNSEFLGQCVASIVTILNDINQLRFLFYTVGISRGLSSTHSFEMAESEVLNDSDININLKIKTYFLEKAINRIKEEEQMLSIIKYGLYLINKNNLDITTNDFLKKMLFGFIENELHED